jgi:transcriptional regulator with XRE-family HTH domain
MLDQEELRRRIRAARMLSDISQADMSEAGHDRGLGKHELSQAERGKITIRHFHLPMLCEILGVPMSWFTEPRHVIVAQRADDYRQLIDELAGLTAPTEEPEAPSSGEQAGGGQPGTRLGEVFSGSESQPRPRRARGQGR